MVSQKPIGCNHSFCCRPRSLLPETCKGIEMWSGLLQFSYSSAKKHHIRKAIVWPSSTTSAHIPYMAVFLHLINPKLGMHATYSCITFQSPDVFLRLHNCIDKNPNLKTDLTWRWCRKNGYIEESLVSNQTSCITAVLQFCKMLFSIKQKTSNNLNT